MEEEGKTPEGRSDIDTGFTRNPEWIPTSDERNEQRKSLDFLEVENIKNKMWLSGPVRGKGGEDEERER